MTDEITERNIIAIKTYMEESRAMIKEITEKLKHKDAEVLALKQDIRSLAEQIGVLQVKLYSGGAIS